MLQCREQWLAQRPRPPANVTVAYHYTSSQAIPTIRQVGLLSQKERQQNHAVTNKAFNGAVYGDGKALASLNFDPHLCSPSSRASQWSRGAAADVLPTRAPAPQLAAPTLADPYCLVLHAA
jgi:hypothetical protein